MCQISIATRAVGQAGVLSDSSQLRRIFVEGSLVKVGISLFFCTTRVRAARCQ